MPKIGDDPQMFFPLNLPDCPDTLHRLSNDAVRHIVSAFGSIDQVLSISLSNRCRYQSAWER